MRRALTGLVSMALASICLVYYASQLPPEEERLLLGFSMENLSGATFYSYCGETEDSYELPDCTLNLSVGFFQGLFKYVAQEIPVQEPLFKLELHYDSDWPTGNIIIYPDYFSINGTPYVEPKDLEHDEYMEYVVSVMKNQFRKYRDEDFVRENIRRE